MAKSSKKRIKLGVIANEFFELSISRMGGFGWAASQVAKCFNSDPDLGVDLVFLSGELTSEAIGSDTLVHETRLIPYQQNQFEYCPGSTPVRNPYPQLSRF